MLDRYNGVYLYHGSDVIVKNPLLSKCNDGKDFGRGFYLSLKIRQAGNFSKIIKRRNETKHAIVSEYKLDNLNKLNVYVFEKADEEWLDCIINYRKYKNKKSKWEKYDVLIGKIADDDTSRTINAYLYGSYGEVGSKKAIDIAISMFKSNRLEEQICFKTDKALKHLVYNGYYEDQL